MSDEKTPSIPEMFAVTVKRALGREAMMLGAFATVIGGAVLYGQHALAQVVRTEVDAGITATAKQAAELEEKLRRHERESAEVHQAIKADVTEVQRDIRALYKAVMTGQRQERLEVPAKDGGP